MRDPIRIEIDRLVIDAPVADRRELVRAIRRELERLDAGGGPRPGGGRPGGRLEIGDRALEPAAGAAAGEIGQQIARTIWTAAAEAARGEETR